MLPLALTSLHCPTCMSFILSLPLYRISFESSTLLFSMCPTEKKIISIHVCMKCSFDCCFPNESHDKTQFSYSFYTVSMDVGAICNICHSTDCQG